MAASTNAIKAGEAYINLSLEDADLADGLSAISSKFNRLTGPLLAVGGALGAAATAMIGPFLLGLHQMMSYTAEVQRAADRTGIAGEEMSRLALAAKFTGSSFQALEIGLKTIGERVLQLRAGSGETVSAFRLLGINIQEFISAGSTSDRLVMIARHMSQVKDAGVQAGLALRTLGEAGNQLLPLLRLGDNLEGIMARAGAIAATQSEMDKALRVTTAWEQATAALNQAWVSIMATISDDFANALDVVTNLVIRFINWMRTPWGQEVAQTVVVVAGAIAGLSAVFITLGTILGGIGAILLVMKAGIAIFGAAFSAVAVVLIKVIAIIGAFVVVVGSVVGFFSGAFEFGITMTERFVRVWDYLVDAVKGGATVLIAIFGQWHNSARWMDKIDGWSRSIKNWFSSWGDEAETAKAATDELKNAMDPLTQSMGSFGSYANSATMGSAPSMTISQSLMDLNTTAQEGNALLSEIASNTKGGLQ